MEGESGVTRSMIDELHCWDIQRDQMECESGVTRSIIDELEASDIQGHQMEGEGAATRGMIDELLLRISNEIKWKVKDVLLEV